MVGQPSGAGDGDAIAMGTFTLVRDLERGDAATRRRAVEALAHAGADANAAVPALVRTMLVEVDPGVLEGAADALGAMGAAAAMGVPALAHALDYEDERVRTAAGLALGRIGTPALPALVSALSRAEHGAEGAALCGIERVCRGGGESSVDLTSLVPLLVRVFRDAPGTEARASAARCLGAIGAPAREATTILAYGLDDIDVRVRSATITALGAIAPPAEGVAALTRGLSDPAESVRLEALGGFARLGATARPHAGVLGPLLASPNRSLRCETWHTLAAIGLDDDACERLLDGALSHHRSSVRVSAVEALPRLGFEDVRLVGRLTAVLGDPVPRVRQAAAIALRDLGRRAAAAHPALLRLLSEPASADAAPDPDPDPDEQLAFEYAIEAAVRVGEPGDAAATVRVLGELVAERASSAAAIALATFGPDSATALDALTAAFRDGDDSLRVAAGRALAALGPAARPAAEVLHEAAEEGEPWLAAIAREALAALAPDDDAQDVRPPA